MKKLFCVLLFMLTFGISTAFAAPFLVCDPQTDVTQYVITLDAATETVAAVDLGDGTVRLEYDLDGITEGAHDIEVKAKNIWGESSPVPLAFTKVLPAAPGNLSIE